MANNKVVFGQEVLIDLTQDTVTPYALEEGYTAHAPSGEKIVGVMKPNKPVEVATNAEMTAISTGATEKDLGKVYLFVGEDDGVFEKDALYILVKKGTGYGFQRYAIGGSGEESTPLQEKTVEITENRTTEVLPDEGYALSKVIVNTNVAGREDLDAELNEQEALIAELKEKLANGGGGSQECDCVIDVTELPTENIDENAVYKARYANANVYAEFSTNGGDPISLYDMFSEYLNPNIIYSVVDEQPENPLVSNITTCDPIYVYIWGDIPYVYADFGAGEMWENVSVLFANYGLTDKGYIKDPYRTTEPGVYVSYVENAFAVANENAFLRHETEWVSRDALFSLDALLRAKEIKAEQFGRANYIKNNLFGSVFETDKDGSVTSGSLVNAALEKITIPTRIQYIGRRAFYNCKKLTSIIYEGTKEQWKAVGKGNEWDNGTPDYIITCTDGTIAKDGTET